MEKVKCEESDDDVDEIGEDVGDYLQLQKRTTPAKWKKQSQELDATDDRDECSGSSSGGGNNPLKPPWSLHLLEKRVKGGTPAKPKPKAAS